MRRLGAVSLFVILVITVAALVGTLVAGNRPQLGLDLQGGASVTLLPTEDTPDDRLDQAIEIIRNRIDALGVAEPEISRQGNAIVVNLPGVEDQDRALEVVGRTAVLQFRPVLSVAPPTGDANATTTAPGETTTTVAGQTTTTAAGETTTTAASASGTTQPGDGEPSAVGDEYALACGPDAGTADTDDPTQPITLPGADADDDGGPDSCYGLGPVPVGSNDVVLSGEVINSAQAIIPANEWVVQLDFTSGGLAAFNEVAEQCFNSDPTTCPSRQIAITLDGRVESAPQIQPDQSVFQPFTRDGVTISGGASNPFSEQEAKDLALILRFGALPVELTPQTVQTVSATLGRDSLRAGLIAGLVGVALVAVYMLLYYRALGVVVVLGLAVWTALMYSIIAFLGENYGLALTLAGVTGVIVSIGITVDSYVVYFERLKDEIRSGKTLRTSVDRGFKRAFRTILAANITAFIGAALLFWLTVGAVRGFAFMLGLATMLDVITAWFFTQPLVALLARNRFFTEAPFMGVARGLGAPVGPATPSPRPAPAGGGS
ncbi:MAG: protein translocase subunit SecD [Acidimicrobiales bacterium]